MPAPGAAMWAADSIRKLQVSLRKGTWRTRTPAASSRQSSPAIAFPKWKWNSVQPLQRPQDGIMDNERLLIGDRGQVTTTASSSQRKTINGRILQDLRCCCLPPGPVPPQMVGFWGVVPGHKKLYSKYTRQSPQKSVHPFFPSEGIPHSRVHGS